MKPRPSESTRDALRQKRAYEAYNLLRWAAGKPVDRAAKALLVPQRVKV